MAIGIYSPKRGEEKTSPGEYLLTGRRNNDPVFPERNTKLKCCLSQVHTTMHPAIPLKAVRLRRNPFERRPAGRG